MRSAQSKTWFDVLYKAQHIGVDEYRAALAEDERSRKTAAAATANAKPNSGGGGADAKQKRGGADAKAQPIDVDADEDDKDESGASVIKTLKTDLFVAMPMAFTDRFKGWEQNPAILPPETVGMWTHALRPVSRALCPPSICVLICPSTRRLQLGGGRR
jgi:hypothetical protein